MILERHFEIKTRGLVCGIPTLTSDQPGTSPIILPRSQLFRPLAKQELHVDDDVIARPEGLPWDRWWKVVIRSREGNEILWQRPFGALQEAQISYLRLCGVDFERLPQRFVLPRSWVESELQYELATVVTYNSTNTDNTKDWTNGGNLCPSGVSSVDCLVIAGGGTGGKGRGGGGGAGGYLTATGLSVVSGNSYTITVGAGGASGATAQGNSGSSSVFSSLTAIGGGGGGYVPGSNGSAGSSGGSGGGGGAGGGGSGGSGGAGTGGQGNTGGSGSSNNGGGGGGGSGASGSNASGSNGGGGGNGTASSITGSSVTRAGGGGAAALGGSAGAAGTGGATAGSNSGDSSAATANTGSGSGGTEGGGTAGAGGSGVDILSFVPADSGCPPVFLPFT